MKKQIYKGNWQKVFRLPVILSGQRRGREKKISLAFCLLPFAFCLLLFPAACRSRDALLSQAQVAWDKEDWKTTTARYEDFLRESPPPEQAAEIHFKAGNVYYLNLKEYERAAEHYIRLVEDFPAFKELELAYLRLAECHTEMKKSREAISEYENLLKTFPDTPQRRKIRLEIANLYYENDKGQALVEYQKVVKDAPYDSLSEKAYLRLGGVRVIRNEFEEAIAPYQAVVANTQDANLRREARDHLASCYENAGNYEEAIKLLEQTEADPKDPDYFKKRISGVRERQKTRKLIQVNSAAAQKTAPQ